MRNALVAALALLFYAPAVAQDKKISELPDGSPGLATDAIPIARGTGNYRLPFSAFFGQGVDIKRFGAKGDGITDDTAAFTAAYTALAGAACGGAGGMLMLSAGTYVISSSLSWMCTNTGMIRLVGESAGGTNGANGAATIIKYTGADTMLTSRHLQLQHVRIQTTTGATGIRLDRCNKDCWIDDVVIDGFSTYGLDISSATSQFTTTISRLRAINNGRGVFISANRTTIVGAEINANTVGGILIDQAAQVTIQDSSIETNNGPGIEFATHKSRAVVIQGNYFERNTTAQILFAAGAGADGVLIAGNYLNGLSVTTTGIDCTVCGDAFIVANASMGHMYGVNIGSSSYRVTVVDSSPGGNTNDYDSKNGLMSMISSKGIDVPPITFTNLAAFTGRIVYCSDCTETDPCAGSGTGAMAMRVFNRWDCN